MKADYIYMVIIFFVFLCFARYMRWRDLKEMGESSRTEAHEKPANLKLMQGVSHELGVHNQRDNNNRAACLPDSSSAETGEVLREEGFKPRRSQRVL